MSHSANFTPLINTENIKKGWGNPFYPCVRAVIRVSSNKLTTPPHSEPPLYVDAGSQIQALQELQALWTTETLETNSSSLIGL